jgi:hypothetical protein
MICRWLEDFRDKNMLVEHFDGAQCWAHHHFLRECNDWDIVTLKFERHFYQIIPMFYHLKGLKFNYSKQES